MIIIAMTLYLPQHIAFLTNRAWFYYHGDENVNVHGVVTSVVESPTIKVVVEKARETVAAVGKGMGDGERTVGGVKEL